MAEVLMRLSAVIADEDGTELIAQACGRERDDGLWEGWIEFLPVGGGTALRTPAETEQPNRRDLEYWATGLSAVYLEGALERARLAAAPDPQPAGTALRPSADRPADSGAARAAAAATRQPQPHSVLDPFKVFAQGEDVLRSELGALHEMHLRNIVVAHHLLQPGEVDLHTLQRPALVDLIVAAVRARKG